MTRNILNINQLRDKIARLFENSDKMDFLKTVAKGSLKLLPAPKEFSKYMPAILINVKNVKNDITIKSIQASVYTYEIIYLKYYNDTDIFGIVEEEFISECESIGNLLLTDTTIQKLIFPNGRCLQTSCSDIEFDTDLSLIFEDLKLPVLTCSFFFSIYYTSYKNKEV